MALAPSPQRMIHGQSITKSEKPRQDFSCRIGNSKMVFGYGNVATMATKIRKGAKLHLYLQEHMDARGYSDAKLADLLETSATTVWRWRKGRRPSDMDLARIAFVFDCEPMDLYSPPHRPSIDAKLAHVSDEMHKRIHDLVDTILNTGT